MCVVPRGCLADYVVRFQKIFILHFGKVQEEEGEGQIWVNYVIYPFGQLMLAWIKYWLYSLL